MEIPIVGNCLGRLPLVFLASFVLWFPLFYFFGSVYMVGNIPGSLLNGNFANSAIPGESNFFHVPLYSDGNTSDFTDPVEEADDSNSPLNKVEEKLRTSRVETDGIVEKSVDVNSVKKTEPYLQAIDTSEEKEDEAFNRGKMTVQSNVETNGFVKKIVDFNSGKEIYTSQEKEDEEFNRGKTTSQSNVETDGLVKGNLDFNSGKELDTSEKREEEKEAFSRGKTTSQFNVETDGFVKKSLDFNSVKEQGPYSPAIDTSEKNEEANNRDETTPQRPVKKSVDLDSVKEPEPPAIDTSEKKEEEAFSREKTTSQSHLETDVIVNKSVDFNSVKTPEPHSPAIDTSEKKEEANNRDKNTPQRSVKKSVDLDSVKEPEPPAIDTPEKKEEEAFNREKTTAAIAENQPAMEVDSHNDSCFGRYIYVHHIPAKFNDDLLKNCRSLSTWTDMCEFTSNNGLGPRLPNTERVYSNNDWFATNQFSLEVIFHNKMKNYQCLTTNSSKASAIFVPYYAGLDVARYLWGYNSSVRDRDSHDLVRWLRQKPEWKTMSGRDHFLVAGRISWDFRRPPEENPDWGNRLLDLPESKKMTMLVIESSPWKNNDFAIPYPTYFHPSNDAEILWWQNRMRRLKRQSLFSFVGSRRPNLRHSIRNEIINQCEASNKTCTLLECNARVNKCYKPVYIMKMFQSSVFCLQPPGDSFTRRSAFDSILAGCIPVFFHPGSAYVQYIWHLPKDHKSYSVLIPANEVKSGSINIEKVLMKIPRRKVIAMREEVIKLIPKIVYANPTGRLERFEDAFDITVKGVIDRVDRIRKEAAEGKSKRIDYAEKISWKYVTFGTVEQHEWDPFFNGSLERES